MKFALLSFLLSISTLLSAQDSFDTIPQIVLPGITISTVRYPAPVYQLPEVHGVILVGTKKNEVLDLTSSSANLAAGMHRQAFARIPGIMLWENDGSGIQVGIATRGLSPNRSWEFNTRQNGYDITPDMFGYPEAYYTPPLEALQSIEVIRGAASLQFGPQFGGMVNNVLKNGKGNRTLFYEGKQSLGTYRFADTFNALGGQKGKWNYYGFIQQRSGDGWRQNSAFTQRTAYASAECAVSDKVSIGLNYTHSEFLSQQPGGLTQEQFESDWQQSTRSRNWLNVPWNVAAVFADIKTTRHSTLNIKGFGMLADRSSVGFMKAINIADTFNTATHEYNTRKLDIDRYETWGAEARWLLNYKLGLQEAHLAVGARYSDSHTHRRVDGAGSTSTEYSDQLAAGTFAKDLEFDNINTSFFVEHLFHAGAKLSITPGVRLEQLASRSSGYIALNTENFEPVQRTRFFPLAGIGIGYKLQSSNLYANVSQAYRPITYSDLTPAGTTDVIDPDLKDASGLNADGGWRGILASAIKFDVGVFYLYYNNRIGTIQRDAVNLKTNMGASVSRGAEVFVETLPKKFLHGYWNVFA
ncbi:MAG: TonB-dependent receptor family protein, partial [Flavobacteriales bacterium]